MPLDLLPSAPKAAVAWTKAQADLAAIHGGRVGTRLNATLPAVRVQQISGSVPDPWQGLPVLQFEFWSADEATADLMARTFLAALPSFRGEFDSGRVYTFVVESGPFWSPDDPSISNNARYIVTVRLLTSP